MAVPRTHGLLIAFTLVLAALGLLDAILFGIYTQILFAIALVGAGVKAREPSRAPVKVITGVAALQGLLVVAFLLFGGEDTSGGETAVAVSLVAASACTVALGVRELWTT